MKSRVLELLPDFQNDIEILNVITVWATKIGFRKDLV